MDRRQEAFSLAARGLLMALAVLGGYVVVGGDVSWPEGGFLLACIGLNELRLRLKLERSNGKMVAFWAALFVAAPFLYLWQRLDFTEAGTSLAQRLLYPPVVLTIALPFQAFAAYLPTMPKAQHLVYAFVLVEAVLGVRQGRLTPMWPWLVALTVMLALCLVATHAAQAAHRRKRVVVDGPVSPVNPGALLKPGLIFALAPMLMAALVLTFAFFVVLPRGPGIGPGEPGFTSSNRRNVEMMPERNRPQDRHSGLRGERGDPKGAPDNVSGLSNTVGTGEIGQLLLSETPYAALSVRDEAGQVLPAGAAQSLYLKVYTLDKFDGANWTASETPESLLRTLEPEEGAFLLHEPPTPKISHTLLLDYVFAEPQGARTLYLPVPYASDGVTAMRSGTGEVAEFTAEYSVSNDTLALKLPEHVAAATGVTVRSRLAQGGQQMTGPPGEELNDARVNHLKALPRSFLNALNTGWAERSRFKQFRRQQELAAQLANWFRSEGGFQYSLVARPTGDNALLQFICDRSQRVGHCEYFASAMAAVLRSFGIPARVCSGFAVRLKPDGTTTVKYSDAHAWVEAYITKVGWQRFDPTAGHEPGGPPSAQDSPVDTTDEPDAVAPVQAEAGHKKKRQQADPVAAYSGEDMNRWLDSAGDALADAAGAVDGVLEAGFSALPGRLQPTQPWQRFAIVGLLLSAGIMLGTWARQRTSGLRRRVRAGLEGSRAQRIPAAALYRELLEALALHGFQRRPSQTPREFAALVTRAAPQLAAAGDATELFYSVRFGEQKDAKVEQYRELVHAIAVTAKHGAAGGANSAGNSATAT